MKPSSIVFVGILAIFVIFGILTSNYLVFPVMGIITGFVVSWIYKLVTHEGRSLSNSRVY
ncbi:MAG: hypothetical protein JRN15_23495 [Nitrososphaerota archaeon]|nr:hypothetical protein [Nitrososphaerota archaeon]